MHRVQHLKLPVGDAPGWELEDEEVDEDGESNLKSIPESFMILQSLRQSRDRWLSSTFPKFASKARGSKQPDVVPPPHTIQFRGRCELEIGPHTFIDTAVFEAHYLADVPQPNYMYYPPSQSGSSWQVTTPYSMSGYAQQGTSTSAAASTKTENLTSQPSVSPLFSSITSSVAVTPQLVARVNAAATTNPTLANLLHLAASSTATPDQLKSLGLIIQSFSTPTPGATPTPPPASAPLPSTTHSATQPYYYQPALTPPRPFDLVLEFREAAADRWIFPRTPVVCEAVARPGGDQGDILISARMPFDKRSPFENTTASKGTGKETSAGSKGKASTPVPIPPQTGEEVVTFRFNKSSQAVWDTVYRWSGGQDALAANRAFLRSVAVPDPVYLAHQLEEGPLLTQIQNAATPAYTMKHIKPTHDGDNAKPKRRSAARKRRESIGTPRKDSVTSGIGVGVENASKPPPSVPTEPSASVPAPEPSTSTSAYPATIPAHISQPSTYLNTPAPAVPSPPYQPSQQPPAVTSQLVTRPIIPITAPNYEPPPTPGPSVAAHVPMPPHTPTVIPRKRSASQHQQEQQPSSSKAAPKAKAPRRSKGRLLPPLPKIACCECGQTDVPLMMGGRWCRPCVDAGKATVDAMPAVRPMSYDYSRTPSSSSVPSARGQSAPHAENNPPSMPPPT
ncbi:hypothetical protein PLICRDRAFT_36362 [Plicaturopsis crispa FD-325 SS-3]|nr:hypothetical protein PLICRDRAFT_36362 [Plicaturopsis crispa FD-325 SS-3]